MIRNYNAFSAMLSSSLGIFAREDSFQDQGESGYFSKVVNHLPSVRGFLSDMGVIAIDDRISERPNSFSPVSQNDRRGQWGPCLVLLAAGARDRHVYGYDYGLVAGLLCPCASTPT